MQSVRSLYKIGIGPSSSHTMGPAFAAEDFLKNLPDTAEKIVVTLYGSLAKTGKGHGTDRAIANVLNGKNTKIIFNTTETDLPHPNTIDFEAFDGEKSVLKSRVLSVGGGEIEVLGQKSATADELYNEKTFSEIAEYCKAHNLRLSDYVFMHEDENFKSFLSDVWQAMCGAIAGGLAVTGTLPGGLNVERKAQHLWSQRHIDESPQTRENRIVCAYAFAVRQNCNGAHLWLLRGITRRA